MLTPYSKISDYWNANPCAGGNPKFPFHMFKGAKVLEVGCGAGVDAMRFVQNGANYTGIDITQVSLLVTREKIGNQGRLENMNAEYMDFPDNYFDLVYSWGVIHHAVNPANVTKEIYRILKPNGFISVMLYGKPSFRYFEIMVLRKILWHLRFHRYYKLREETPHPTKEQWISWNTDNLGCPLSRVYTKKEAIALLSKFKISKSWAERYGWFRILVGRKEFTTS